MGAILIRAARLLAAAMAVAAAGACSTSGCLENQSAVPRAGFYSSASGESVTIDSLVVFGVGAPGDSLLKSDDTAASSIYLPLRSTTSTTSFCFRYTQRLLDSPALNDTLSITYTSTPRFVSEECGAMYFYTITSLAATTHLIDSAVVMEPEVDNYDRTTIAIYFRTSSAGGDDDPDAPEGEPDTPPEDLPD